MVQCPEHVKAQEGLAKAIRAREIFGTIQKKQATKNTFLR